MNIKTWALILLSSPAFGQEAASFLLIGSGARSQSLGGAVTALAGDKDSLFSNPAGLSGVSRYEMGASHSFFLGDSLDTVSAVLPLGSRTGGNWGVLGLGVTRMGYGTMEGRGEDRRSTGRYSASDWALSAAYGRPMAWGVSAGLAVKRVQSRIADASAGATAFDAGMTYDLKRAWKSRLGAAIRNFGGDMSFSGQAYPLPLILATGITMEPISGLLLSAEIQRRPKGNQTFLGFGSEYRLHPAFALRAGYLRDHAPSRLSLLGGFSGGFGLISRRLNFDYAVTPLGRLGSVQTLSLTARY